MKKLGDFRKLLVEMLANAKEERAYAEEVGVFELIEVSREKVAEYEFLIDRLDGILKDQGGTDYIATNEALEAVGAGGLAEIEYELENN